MLSRYLILLSIFAMFLLSSCRPEQATPNPYTFQKQDSGFFGQFVNQRNIPADVAKEEVLRLVNDEYPIELALFSDGKFYYYLENLGDGQGKWRHEDGKLKLIAERELFTMFIGVNSISEFDNRIAIDFVDRHGTQYLEVEKVKSAIK